jgi:general secretion pathway protein D
MALATTMAFVSILWGTGALAQKAPPPEPLIAFKFKDAKITSVMEYLSRQTGWTFLLDTKGEVKSKAAKVSITAVEALPVTRDRAVDLLNHALASHGLHAVRFRETVVVMTSEEAKKRSFEIYVGSDPKEVPLGDNMITQIIPLQYSDATEIEKELKDMKSDVGKMYLNKQSNSLILQDTATNVKRFLTVIHTLDQGVTKEIEIKPFTLKNADASEVARVIQEIFTEEETNQRRPRGLGGLIRSFMGGRSRGSAESTKITPGQKVKVSVDPRTNTVVVKAAKDTMRHVVGLIEKMDLEPAEVETTFVYHLKNADVTNVSTILNNVLRGSGTGRRSTGGRSNQRQGGFPWFFGGGGRSGRSTRGGGGRGGGTRRMQTIGAQEGGTGDQLYGDVNVQPDAQSNSLIVRTNPKNFPLLKRLIDELDMVRAQVLIKVFIAEVTLDDETDMGMEWSWQDDLQVGDDQGSASSRTDFDLTSGTKLGGFRYQLISENIDVLVRALKRKGKLKVLSAPRILVLDNEEASIQVGREIPRITNSRVTEQGDTINSVQYENVGISLQVTPHINPDGLVRMSVQPEVSEVAPKSEGVPISEGAVAPVFVTSTASTTVSIQDGHTIIIGGLIRDRTSVSESKVPIVGDIPLLGLLFQTRTYEITKTELMVFLTPVVVRNTESLKRLSQREAEALELMERGFLDRVANDGIPLDRIRRKRLKESTR